MSKKVIQAQFENFVNCYNKNKDNCYYSKSQKKIDKLINKMKKVL